MSTQHLSETDDANVRLPMTGQRKIIHVDMDAFYAAFEQRDNPDLRGKPVAVGGASQRGVVATASYEARKFGIHSAMPSVIAQRKCPELIFVKPRFDVYREVSRQIRVIFSAMRAGWAKKAAKPPSPRTASPYQSKVDKENDQGDNGLRHA